MSTTNYAVVHFFPGGTSANYEASIHAVHPGEGVLPVGQVFHAAGATTETEQAVDRLVRYIQAAGRIPVERDTLYNKLRRWD